MPVASALSATMDENGLESQRLVNLGWSYGSRQGIGVRAVGILLYGVWKTVVRIPFRSFLPRVFLAGCGFRKKSPPARFETRTGA